MKKLLLFVLCFGLIGTSVCFAQETEQLLQLTIKSDKQVYAVGEEIVINAEFKNNSKEIIILSFAENSLNLDWDFNFNIKRNGNPLPSQRAIDYKSLIYKRRKKEIAADDSYNVRLLLSKINWIEESPFLKKGMYHIEISYSYQIAPDQVTTITSNTITIEVVEKKEGIRKEKAIEIAKAYAVKQGIYLASYPEITATFKDTDKAWDILFSAVPAFSWFHIIIDAETGEVLELLPGE